MIIRFALNNFFSFGQLKEFNMLPSPRYRRLGHHRYEEKHGLNILKLSSIYGANGAGKSNLIEAMAILQNIVLSENVSILLQQSRFKFHKKNEIPSQILAVEFFQDDIPFYYALELIKNRVATEELYISGLGKKEDTLIFERKTNQNNQTSITFLAEFEQDKEGKILKKIIEKNLSKPNKTIFKLLTTLDNEWLKDTVTAFKWFSSSLQIIRPNSKPSALAHWIDIDKNFKKYAEDLMCSFNIGIKNLISEKKNIIDFFGEDNLDELDELLKKLEETPRHILGLKDQNGSEIVLVKENDGNIYIKELKLEHEIQNGIKAIFDLDEESDGTIRLLDFIPAFQEVVQHKKVFIIDEVERSIHPLLIKELLKKFSFDKNTKGQLIFSTHESNLLDQEFFRQDEIWFAQKDKNGCTDLYSLSDFKEHNTIDIRKGYLNGRYGSIPFLANVHDLNWHNYDIKK